MKIQLTSTLPFTPVQLDADNAESEQSARRVVGELLVIDNGMECRTPVYEFRHFEDRIEYRVSLLGDNAVTLLKNAVCITEDEGQSDSDGQADLCLLYTSPSPRDRG